MLCPSSSVLLQLFIVELIVACACADGTRHPHTTLQVAIRRIRLSSGRFMAGSGVVASSATQYMDRTMDADHKQALCRC